MDCLLSMLGRNGFLPHGHCFTWSPGLLWSMVTADAVIAAAHFSIPVAMLSYVRQRQAARSRPCWTASSAGRGLRGQRAGTARVLIVDDNEMNVTIAQEALAAGDVETESAADAAEGLHKVASFRPELILMDIQMPGVNGLEMTRRLKADPATRGILILAFTAFAAFAMRGDEARFREAGCDGYVSKPIDVKNFARQIQAWLDQRAPAAEG